MQPDTMIEIYSKLVALGLAFATVLMLSYGYNFTESGRHRK